MRTLLITFQHQEDLKSLSIFFAITATFLGDMFGSNIGNKQASKVLPCSWRNNNLSSRI